MFRIAFFWGILYILMLALGPSYNSWAMLSAFLLGGLWGFSHRFIIRITRGESPE